MEEIKAFTYKEDRDQKNSGNKSGSFWAKIINKKEEILTNVEASLENKNFSQIEDFKIDASFQNHCLRKLIKGEDKESVFKEITIFYFDKKGYFWNEKMRTYVNKENKPLDNYEIEYLSNRDVLPIKKGLESAYKITSFILETQTKGSGEIYFNDTLDAVNKIDLLKIKFDTENNMGIDEITFIQSKSRKPYNNIELEEMIISGHTPYVYLSDSKLVDYVKETHKMFKVSKKIDQQILNHKSRPETVESIYQAHRDYLLKSLKIAEELEKKNGFEIGQERFRGFYDKYGLLIFAIFDYLADLRKKNKIIEELNNKIILEINKEQGLNLNEFDLKELAFKLAENPNLGVIIAEIGGTKININDSDLFQDWLKTTEKKSEKRDNKKIIDKIYKNNIISGQKFYSDVYYLNSAGVVEKLSREIDYLL